MTAYIVVLATRDPAAPFAAKHVEAKNEEAAGFASGGHFIHVHPYNGEASIVHEEMGVKHALLVEGAPIPRNPPPAQLDDGEAEPTLV